MTQDRLKFWLTYDPFTGLFVWNHDRVRGKGAVFITAGAVAGSANDKGYTQIKIEGRNFLAHRLAWLYMMGEWPPQEIDHLNRVRNDNRWVNLRSASAQQNRKNSSTHSNNTTGYLGVRRSGRRFVGALMSNGRNYRTEIFDRAEDAAIARDALARRVHGAFASESAAR